MCSIAGICDFTKDLRMDYSYNEKIVSNMGVSMLNRGPDDFRTIVDENIAFAHTRLAVIDIDGGAQPMTKIGANKEFKILAKEFYQSKCPLKIIDNFNRYSIIYNGELYNTKELKDCLIKEGYEFETSSDTEVLLTSYIHYGEDCVDYLNGIFAFAIWDSRKKRLFVARDRFGVKPLFYCIIGEQLVFASEIKALFCHPDVKPVIDDESMRQVFGIGPARTPGSGVFHDIYELKPGYALTKSEEGIDIKRYYQIPVFLHKENYKDTVKHTWDLLNDAITRQLVSDVPLCTLLSGGLDSSVVSAVAARRAKEKGETLSTYSFNYNDDDIYFQANDFQPTKDEPYALIMAKHIGSNHRSLYCSHIDLYSALFDAVKAKDLPGMADVDSSMLYFARLMKQNHTVCLSGECADEVFGGYPWFRDEEWFKAESALDYGRFPWTKNLEVRKGVLRDDVEKRLSLDDYVNCAFKNAIEDTPLLYGETKRARLERIISYLNIRHFMTTLLDRKDRTTMYCGLEVRVPFADHKLVEYIYNVPWSFKCRNGVVKGLLRDATGFLLPDEVKNRKKSPYPKSYDPKYENLLKRELSKIIYGRNEPVMEYVSKDKIETLLQSERNVVKPWFGQLMAGPQLFAYIIQVNYWLKEYS